MKNIIILLLFVFATLGMADEKISSGLQAKMDKMRSEEQIPVVVLFEGLPSFEEIAQEYRFLGEEAIIKEQVIRVLQDKAESLHFWLKQMSENMRGDISNFRSLWIMNGVSINATPSAIREIALQNNVEKIILDVPIPMLVEDTRTLTWGLTKINAEQAWKYYEGVGVTVAVIDTGVNEHGDLRGRVFDGKNLVDATKPPRDDHGHGTHCSGTVAGNGLIGGTSTGVAPKANILAIKVLDSNGSGQWSNLWDGLESLLPPTPTKEEVRVVSMSLGGRPDQATKDRLQLACKNVIASGIIPVIAAGNSGSSAKTINSPGDVPEVISVGATDTNDVIAYFSSRGPVVWKDVEIIKPDVSAPGVSVVSCKHLDNGYTSMSGTSMATPHVAGLVALLVNANPHLDTVTAKSILERTAKDLGTPGKDNSYGSGRVNALAAIQAVMSLNPISSRDARWEMVVKEMVFTVEVDANGNINMTKTISNDLMPATVTIWVDVKETEARQGFYYVSFTLDGPNGKKTGTARIDYQNVPTDPNKFNAQYGYNCGNFDLVKGDYVGSVNSIEPNPYVKSKTVTLTGKATWPARATIE